MKKQSGRERSYHATRCTTLKRTIIGEKKEKKKMTVGLILEKIDAIKNQRDMPNPILGTYEPEIRRDY